MAMTGDLPDVDISDKGVKVTPLGWEYINLSGDDIWRNNFKLRAGKYRPLRVRELSSLYCFGEKKG
ncbi:hypothetical protein [Xenorhabdus sp. TH1]|uniref:hypothetical protein n=1 Tax=Xenorhabdus sp. TH1 TaxID=3130166 RepID=UPI0030D57D44